MSDTALNPSIITKTVKADAKTCIIVGLIAAAVSFYMGVQFGRADMIRVQDLVKQLTPASAVSVQTAPTTTPTTQADQSK